MTYEFLPSALTWPEVDPRAHPFDPAAARMEIPALAPAVPARPRYGKDDPASLQKLSDWSWDVGAPWTEAMTRALVERYGRWVLGWRWAHDEGDIGGGPVGSWCCAAHSITEPRKTLARVASALCEWREWLEDLAERFDRYPLGNLPPEDRQDAWERATAHLVTHVVDRTNAGDAWYGHCQQVLTWFLTRWDVTPARAAALVAEAVGGRFESWMEPEQTVVRDVAERLSASLEPDTA
ncbi:hypothetical protein [Streptomyces colonosanans]|uniref:hypothetical protein n=1 Tax=Streptomyces colonosanans TaxID=1428652 RepID=UPI000D1A729C|nr:hypothetical protein [Streptomyces colonosanans]